MNDYRIHYQKVKSTLRKGSLPGPFLCSKFSFSPYMACNHGCVYCDGRAEKYFVKGEFEKDIVIRSNAPANLEEEMGKLKDKGIISLSSGVSDVYQPAEEKEQITRRCAEILSRCNRPVMVLTKSSLVCRDLPLWEKVNKQTRFILTISLTTLDEKVKNFFEPNASSIEERLETIKLFKDKGCAVGVLAMPFLPGISDSFHSIDLLFEKLAKLKVDFVIPGSLTLRPGRQKDYYLNKIEDPDLIKYYHFLYNEDKESGLPNKSYDQELNKTLSPLFKKHSLNPLMPHSLYKPHYYSYDNVFLLLSHMEPLYQSRGVKTAPLKMALANYTTWLKEVRKKYSRRVGGFRELDFFFKELLAGNKLEEIIKNEKLNSFIKKVVLQEAIYDYKILELI